MVKSALRVDTLHAKIVLRDRKPAQDRQEVGGGKLAAAAGAVGRGYERDRSHSLQPTPGMSSRPPPARRSRLRRGDRARDRGGGATLLRTTRRRLEDIPDDALPRDDRPEAV